MIAGARRFDDTDARGVVIARVVVAGGAVGACAGTSVAVAVAGVGEMDAGAVEVGVAVTGTVGAEVGLLDGGAVGVAHAVPPPVLTANAAAVHATTASERFQNDVATADSSRAWRSLVRVTIIRR